MSEDIISSISIKLPSPWSFSMVAWFALAESQFERRHITQGATQVRRETFMQKLPHLSMKPLSTTPHTDLKAKMLHITSLTDRHRFNALSAEFTVGDEANFEGT